MYIKVITTDNEFDKIKNEWIDFEKKVDNKNIASSYLWQRTWWKNFGHIDNSQYGYDKKLSILFLYNEKKELRAIASFCIVIRKFKKIFHYKSVEFIVQQWGATYLDFISNNLSKNEVDYIFNWLKENRKYDLIHLRYIPEFTNNFDLNGNNATVLSGCPEIKGESYRNVRKEYYSKNLERLFSNVNNRIAKKNIYLKYIVENGNNILEYYKDVVSTSKSKKYSNKLSIYIDIRKDSFIKELVKRFSSDSNCIFLFFNKILAAYNLGYYYNKKYYAIDASYNREIKELKKLSIGSLIFDKLLEDTFSKGIQEFCFGTGIDSYKLRFTKKVYKIYNILYKGNTIKSDLIYKKHLSANKKQEDIFLKELNEKILKEK